MIGATLWMLSIPACSDSDDTAPPIEDTTPPSVISTVPLDGDIGVAIGGNIAVTFSEPMAPETITDATLTLRQGTQPIAGTVAYSGVTATFEPASVLDASTLYTATVSVGVTDGAGNPQHAAFVWSFTTGTTVDTTAPTVLSNLPIDGAISVANNRELNVNFSEAMDATTLNAASFTLAGPATTSVAGTVTYAGLRATFTPSAPLPLDTLFHASLTTGARDLAGNPLAADLAWTFTTSATAARGPAPVLLGTAGGFVILAKSGIDAVPTSTVTGDMGVSPIDATGVTGFSLSVDATNAFATSDQVTGKVFASDYAAPTPANLTTAVSDMEIAYTDAAGRVTPDFTELGSGEIGGMTLAPGLYKWGTGVSISSDVTLDGGADDVWIFQIAGDVTQASGTSVTLSGGASPHNIFWQTFGQFAIGTTAHFEGIALCQTAIILETGASVNGRLLAQTAVTLDQSTVTQPAVPSL